MATVTEFSDTNITNSIAQALADKFIAEGYLIYWAARQTVQTADGFYFDWNTNYATYMADATFSARVSASPGMVTLLEGLPANPTWIFRPITTAGPIGQDEVLLPVISVEVGPSLVLRNMEIGSGAKWRYRHLIVDGYVRTKQEQRKFADFFSQWFDNETSHYTIYNHDAGTKAVVDAVDCAATMVDFTTEPLDVEPKTFQVICNSRLEYVA